MELLRDSSLLSSIQDKAYSKGSSDQECIDDVCYALIAGQNNSSTEVILDIGSPSRELEFLSSLDPLHGWNNPLTGDKDRDVADVHEVETVEEWQDRYAAAVDEDQKASISPLNIVQGQYMLSDTGLMNNLVKLPDEQLLPWKYFFPRANKQRKFSSNEIIPAAATSFTVIQSSGLVPLVMNNSTKPVLIQSTEEGSSEASYLNETSTCDVATTVHMNTSFCCPGGRDFLGVSASSDKTVLTKSQDKGGHCNSSVHNATIFPYSVNSACHLQNKNIAEKTGLGSQGDNDDLVSNARLGTKSRKSLENSRGKPSSTHIFESKMANPTKHKLCLVGGAKEELKKRRLLHYLLPVLPNEADSSAQVPCSSSGSICLTTGTSDVNVRNETIAVPFRAVQYFDKVYITETELKNSEEDLMNRHYEIERESIESVSRAMSKVTKLASRYDGHGIPVKGRKGIFFCKKKDFSKKTVRQLLMSCSTERDLEKDDTINSQSTKYFSENDKCTPKDASKMSRGLAEGSAAVESHENTYCSEICTLPTTEESENLNTSMEADLNERTDPSIAGSGCLPVVEKWRDLHNTITVQSCEKEELYKKPFILIVHESCQHPGDSEGDASKNVLDAGDPTSLQLNQPCSFSDECLVKENAVENKSVIQVQTPCEVSNMASVCSRDSWLHSSFASENGAADSSYAGYLDLDALLDFQDLDLFCEEDIFDKENVKEKPDGNKMARELEILTTGKQNGATIEECSHKPSHLRYSGADDKDFSCMNETLAVQLTGDDQHFKGNKKSHVPDFLELADAIMQIEEDQLQKLQEFELQHLDTDSQCKHTQPLVPETQVQGVQSGSEPMNVEVDEALHHSINKQNHLEKSEYVHDACLGSALEFHLNQDKEQLTKDSVETQSKTDLFIIQDFLDPDKDQAASSSSYSDPLDVWMEESLPPLPPCALFLSKPEHHGNSTYDWLDMNFLHKTAEENPGESTFSSLDCDFWTADCEDCFVQHLENIPQTHVEKMDCDVSGLREHASESIFLQDSSNVIVVHSSVGAELSPGIATADSNRCTSPLSCNSVSLQLPFSDLPMDFTFLRPLSSQSPTTISSCVSKEGEECNSMYREEENYNVENIQGVENALITPMTNDSVPKVRTQGYKTPLLDVDLKVAANENGSCMTSVGDVLQSAGFNMIGTDGMKDDSQTISVEHEITSGITSMTSDALHSLCMQHVKGSCVSMSEKCPPVGTAIYSAKVINPSTVMSVVCPDLTSSSALQSFSADNGSHHENTCRTESVGLRHPNDITATTKDCFVTSYNKCQSHPVLIPPISAASTLPSSRSLAHSLPVKEPLPVSSSFITSWSSSEFLVSHVPPSQYNPACPCHPPSTVCYGGGTDVTGSFPCVPFHPSMLDCQYLYAHPPVLACPSDQIQTPSITESGWYMFCTSCTIAQL